MFFERRSLTRKVPVLHPEQLESFVTSIFEKAGAPRPHAQVVANHLIESNLLGHDSHGVLRVAQYCSAIESGELAPDARPELLKETPAGAVMDGKQSFGQVAVTEAMNLAIEKANRSGTSAVTLSNCYHSGRLGAYTSMAADAGMIGIMMVNAGGGGQSVVPFGGSARRLATNPISVAAPTSGEFPLVLDIATSMAPEGKIRDYASREAPLPEGWIVDADGNPTRDAKDFYADPPGAILPLGGPAGHKGFGLALMIDVLAGALSGAGCCRSESVPARDGVLLIALDVEQFSNRVAFYQHVSELAAYIKSCPTAPGFEEVFVPGEMEYRTAQTRRKNGIYVEESVWRQIENIAARMEVIYKFEAATNGVSPTSHVAPAGVNKDRLTI
jgi:hydroxycarboxylate dehydrogenase B